MAKTKQTPKKRATTSSKAVTSKPVSQQVQSSQQPQTNVAETPSVEDQPNQTTTSDTLTQIPISTDVTNPDPINASTIQEPEDQPLVTEPAPVSADISSAAQENEDKNNDPFTAYEQVKQQLKQTASPVRDPMSFELSDYSGDMTGAEMMMLSAEEFKTQNQKSLSYLDMTFTEFLGEAQRSAVGGVPKGIEELTEFTNSCINWGLNKLNVNYQLPEDVDFVPDYFKPRTLVGNFVQACVSYTVRQAIIQSTVGLIPGANAALLSANTKLSTAVSSKLHLPFEHVRRLFSTTGWGFATDLTRNPNDAIRFSDYLTKFDNPIVNNAFTQFLKSDPNDPRAVAAFKNAVEGIIPNAAFGLLKVYAIREWNKFHGKMWPKKSLDAEELKHSRELLKEVEDYLATGKEPEVGNPKVPNPKPQPPNPDALVTEQYYMPQSGHVDTILTPGADKKPTLLNQEYMPDMSKFWTQKLDASTRAEIMAVGNATENGVLWKIPNQTMRNSAITFVQGLSDIELRGAASQLEDAAVSMTNDVMEKQFRLAAIYQTRVVPLINQSYAKMTNAIKTNSVTPTMSKELADNLSLGAQITAMLYRVRGRFGALLASLQNASDFSAKPQQATGSLLNLTDDELNKVFRELDPQVLMQLAGGINAVSEAGTAPEAAAWFMGSVQQIIDKQKMTAVQVGEHWFRRILYASRLSSLNTHVRNTVENIVRGLGIEQSDALFAAAARGGSFRDALGEVGAGLRGFRAGLANARKAIAYAYKYGENVLTARNAPRIKTDDGLFDAVLDAPTISLTVADEAMAQPLYLEHATRALFRKMNKPEFKEVFKDAKPEVLDAFKKLFIKNYYRDAAISPGVIAQGLTASGKIDTKWGIDSPKALEATMETLMKGGNPKSAFYNTLRWANKIPFLGPLLMPFVNVNYNSAADALYRHNPIGLLRLFGKHADNPEAVSKIIGQFVTTAIMFTSAANLVASGKITGGGPQSPAARKAWLETGRRPYSYCFDGGDYLPLANYSFAAPMVMVASMYDQYLDVDLKSPEGRNLFATTFNAFTGYLLDRTMFMGMSDFTNALEQGDFTYFWNKNFASFVTPQFMWNLRNMADDKVREQNDTVAGIPVGRIANRVPFLSKTLPIKYSWLTGEPIQDAFTGGLTDIEGAGEYDGFRRAVQTALFPVSQRVKDKNEKFLLTMAKCWSLTEPDRVLPGTAITLDDADYSEYCQIHGTIKIAGQTLEQRLTKLFDSETWKNAGVDPSEVRLNRPREDLIQKVVNAYRLAAKQEMLKRHPDMREFERTYIKWNVENRAGRTNERAPVYIKLRNALEQ